jgi:hypothetical protein
MVRLITLGMHSKLKLKLDPAECSQLCSCCSQGQCAALEKELKETQAREKAAVAYCRDLEEQLTAFRAEVMAMLSAKSSRANV